MTWAKGRGWGERGHDDAAGGAGVMSVREWREPLLEIAGIPETRGSIKVPRERDTQLAYRQMARGLREPTFDEAVAMLRGELPGPFWVDEDLPCRVTGARGTEQ